MTLVNAETAEIIVLLSKDEAQVLTARIKGHVSQAWRLLAEAHHRRADLALGYSTWEAYVRAEFDMGRAHAYRLLNQAAVILEIESAVVSVTDAEWVSPDGDIAEVAAVITEPVARDLGPRLAAVTDRIKTELADVAVVDAADLKERLEVVISDERERAQAEAEQKREDRAALANLNEQAQAAGIETDQATIAEQGAYARLCGDLVKQGDAVAFAAKHRDWLNERRIGMAERARDWLDAFLSEAKGSK